MKAINLLAVLSLAVSAVACTAETAPGSEPPAKVEATKSDEESEPPPAVEEHGVQPKAATNPLYQASAAAATNPLY